MPQLPFEQRNGDFMLHFLDVHSSLYGCRYCCVFMFRLRARSLRYILQGFPANTAGGGAAKNTYIINNRFIFHNLLQTSSKELASACNQN